MTAPVFALIPSQGIECTWMGASCHNKLSNGIDVNFELLTDGSASGLGSYYPSTQQFVDERDTEWRNTVAAFGYEYAGGPATPGTPRARILSDRMAEGTLTKSYVMGRIDFFLSNHPNASFFAPSYLATSNSWSDCQVVGEALRDHTGVSGTKAFFIDPHDAAEATSVTVRTLEDKNLESIFREAAPVAFRSARSAFEGGFHDQIDHWHR